ncbi:MAG: CoA transferase [Alphaproteobacteria bacterium]|nr:CoA transferase [Alphaproteobacteria bacterium]
MKPQAAFEYLNRIAGVAPLGLPVFEGAEAIVPTPFRVATAAAASLGFGAAVAGEIWRFRGGDRQTIAVDLKAAASSLVSASLIRRNGQPLPDPQDGNPTIGFYQSADGRWLHLHGGFVHLARRTLDLLNAENDEKSVLDGVSKWSGLALEDAMAFMQLCGAVVRTEEEWRLSVQGRVTGPPIMLKKIGEAPPLRLPPSRAPLAGIRVLDLTRVLAGPTASRILASHGADVLNIRAERMPTIAAYDLDTGAGKRAAFLDLAKPADAETLRRLVRGAQIFVDSYRPGALARLGFSPAALAHIAPGMTYVAVSAYGAEGPWAGRRGWEQLAQSATGIAVEQGAFMAARRKSRRETLPELIPAAVLDYATGYLAAAGAMAALLRRIREGGSWLVQVSLASTAVWLQSLGKIDAASVPMGWEPRDGLDQYLTSCETKDGWLELLGPVVRMSKTPPLMAPPPMPGYAEAPSWGSAHGETNAAEVQSAQA